MTETSIIIRTKNEEKWLGEVLKRLSEQTYQNFEIIIVDSDSTDKTLEIIKNFNVKLIQIKQEEFSYPHALNIGCKNALASKYLVLLSGHSLPSSKTWLQDGINNFLNKKIMGVFGFIWALPDGSIWEKLLFNKYSCWFRNFLKPVVVFYSGYMGVMGFTNAIIRKELWQQYNFNEQYGAGGEDGEWAGYWFNKGYVAIRDIKFSVYHSHGLNIKQLKKQFEYWKTLGNQKPFKAKELYYRNNNY